MGVDSDGDGLRDCEEAFLKTDPLNVDTDGDFLSDLTEIRTGLNPLDATDAFGDINRDGILNGAEIKVGLSPTAQVSASEKASELAYTFTAQPPSSTTMGTCYDFDVEHLRLMTPAKTLGAPQGYNRIYYDVFETAEESCSRSV